MNLMAVIMLISLNGVHVKLLGMRRVYMATWRSCNKFDLLHINKGCPFEPGTRSNQWAELSNTERAVTQFCNTNHPSVSPHTTDYPTIYKFPHI